MPRKQYSTEQIITKLRQAEVELGRGLKTPQVCKTLGISEQTYYRWRKEFGGLRLDQAKRLKALERENIQLKKLVADQARRQLDHPSHQARLVRRHQHLIPMGRPRVADHTTRPPL